jgi:DNA polymerase-1
VLYSDPPCRIPNPGTFPFASHLQAVYTVGHAFVQAALNEMIAGTTRLAADIETFGLGLAARRLKCVAFSDGTRVVVLDPRDPAQFVMIRRTFEYCTEILFHNSPYDIPNLYMNGLISLNDVRKVTDTLIWSRLATPGEMVRKSLEAACDRHMKSGPGGELLKSFKALGFSKKAGYFKYDLDRPIYLQGAASDPLMTHRLATVVRQDAYNRLTQNHPFGAKGVTGDEAWALVDREQVINRQMLWRACKGFRVDFEYLDRYQAENAAELAEADRELERAGVRPGSGADLAKVLKPEGVFPPDFPRVDKTLQEDGTRAYSMTAKNVEKLAHPLARKFIRQKEITKIGKDYLQKCVDLADDNGLIHPALNLLAATTGRASMGDPPLQQFSGPARGILIPDAGGSFTSVDLSQGEPVTVANAARDRQVLDGYESGRSDLYTELGVIAGVLPAGTTTADCEHDPAKKRARSQMKETLLAQLYGQGFPLLTAKLGLDPGPWEPPTEWEIQKRGHLPGQLYPQYAEARRLRKAVFSAMPKTADFILKLKAIAAQHRMMITISGRTLDIPRKQWDGVWRVEEHKGVNYFCQGGQYDLIADAMLRIIGEGLGDALYLTMHDEFVVETEAAHDIRRILETPSERFCMWAGRTPILRTDMSLIGGTGERWGKA